MLRLPQHIIDQELPRQRRKTVRAFVEAAVLALAVGVAAFEGMEIPAKKDEVKFQETMIQYMAKPIAPEFKAARQESFRLEQKNEQHGRRVWRELISIPAGVAMALAVGSLVYRLRRPRGLIVDRSGSYDYRRI